MLASDLINITVGLAEAVRTNRVTPQLVADAVLQLSGLMAQAVALEQNQLIQITLRDANEAPFSPVEVALELLRQALALEACRAMARAS